MNYLTFVGKTLEIAWSISRRNVGRMLREYGLYLDRRGSYHMGDIAYL